EGFLIDAHDLGRAVGAAIGFEDGIAEVLDAEAEACHTDPSNRRQLGTSNGTGLAIEGNLLGRVPGAARSHPCDEGLELARREERRRTAAKINEVEWPAGDGRLVRVELPLPAEQVQVLF